MRMRKSCDKVVECRANQATSGRWLFNIGYTVSQEVSLCTVS